MKIIRHLLLSTLFFASSLAAQDLPVLNIGVERFIPPFVMQSSGNKLYGFDIDMMDYICKALQRTCKYKPMRFDQLFDALARNEIDVAVSAITITPDRAKLVNFSIPYLLSRSHFLTKKTTAAEPFNLALLNGKRIGLESGTIFTQELDAMGIKNSRIKYYTTISDQLAALNNDEVDFILLDHPMANYWAANSADIFKLAGPAYMYGYGLGIAVNTSEGQLLTMINQILTRYQNSQEYKDNFNRYLVEF